MILRVYAMWNRSKQILYFLLFIYVPQVIISFVFTGIYNNPNTYLSGVSQARLQVQLESHLGGSSYPTTLSSSLNPPSC